MPTWVNESDPLDVMKDLIDTEWVAFEDIPKPKNILVVNEAEDPRSRFDMNKGDVIVIKTDAPETLRGRGNFNYYDKAYQITIEFYTKESRQRLRNIGRMLKAIIFDNKHNFTGYQFIRIASYQEFVEENLNVWRGNIRVQVESAGVIVETLV